MEIKEKVADFLKKSCHVNISVDVILDFPVHVPDFHTISHITLINILISMNSSSSLVVAVKQPK